MSIEFGITHTAMETPSTKTRGHSVSATLRESGYLVSHQVLFFPVHMVYSQQTSQHLHGNSTDVLKYAYDKIPTEEKPCYFFN